MNFDGLVGPTHNYAGLAFGNVASLQNQGALSSPREAALQGLEKMKFLADLGLAQGFFPPHERPHLPTLRALGFAGASDAEVVAQAARQGGNWLSLCSSASAMWTANAATVAPSSDSEDGRLHLVPANLCASLHRSIEADFSARMLNKVFAGPSFAVHPPLPASAQLQDEGAANHMRLAAEEDPAAAYHIFVYGRAAGEALSQGPQVFPDRQTLEASRSVARQLRLPEARCRFLRQSPRAIDAGVFHNDVIALSHLGRLLFHEEAFAEDTAWTEELQQALGSSFRIDCVRRSELSLEDCVASYLFNSQLLSLPAGGIVLVAPEESAEHPRAHALVRRWLDEGLIDEVRFLSLRQSMRNGGGPACLRLRVQLREAEIAELHPPMRFDETRYQELRAWVEKHYRDRLEARDLADPQLLEECRQALDALTQLLELDSLYDFQRSPT